MTWCVARSHAIAHISAGVSSQSILLLLFKFPPCPFLGLGLKRWHTIPRRTATTTLTTVTIGALPEVSFGPARKTHAIDPSQVGTFSNVVNIDDVLKRLVRLEAWMLPQPSQNGCTISE